jgi:PAS domain S-box-containing protein
MRTEYPALFQTIVEQSGEGIFLADAGGDCVLVNPAFCRMTGYDEAELMTMNVRRLVAPDDDLGPFFRVLQGRPGNQEAVLSRKDGVSLIAEFSGHPVQLEERKLILGIVRDITENRNTTEQIERRLAFSQTLVRLADGIITQQEADEIFTTLVRTIGETLEVDRALIYDIRFDDEVAAGLCEWLNPKCPGLTPTKATYPLDLFRNTATFVRETRRWLESHNDDRNTHLDNDGSARLLHEEMSIRSLLWYPFGFRNDGYFVLVFNQVSRRREWAADELAFVDAATRQASLAAQKLTLLAERGHAENLRTAVYRIARAADQAEQLEELYAAIHSIIQTVMPAGNFFIALCDESSGLIHFPYHVDERSPRPPSRQPAKGWTEYVLRHGASQLFDERRHQEMEACGEVELIGQPAAVWLGAPLIVESKTIGVMAAQHYSDPSAYGERERDILEYVASQIAQTIDRKNKEVALRQSDAKMRSLARLARELELVRSYSEIVRPLRDQIRSVLGYRVAWIYLVDDDCGRARLLEAEGVPVDELGVRERGFQIKGDAYLEAVLEADGPIVIEDAQTDPRTDKKTVVRLGNRTIVAVPVALEHRRLGAITTGTYGDEGVRIPTPSELDFLQAVARQVAVVVDRVRFLVEIEESQQALRASNAQLETALAELRNTQETMIQRERLAAVGQLTAGIAHDFNNILTGILGSADVVRLTPDMPEAARKQLERIVTSSQGAARLVRRMLDFSRKSVHHAQTVDMAPLAEEMIDFLRRAVPESIRLDLEIKPGSFVVEADVTQLQQVLTNLVVNARDAMPDGGRLQVVLSRSDTTGEEICSVCGEHLTGAWVCLQVQDHGEGIESDVLPHIFEPFFTSKEASKGSGLGLAQVAGIVSQHKGHVKVVSKLGEGAEFSVYLPPSRQKGPFTPSPPDQSQLVSGDGQTILLVEDDPAVCEIVQDMLENLNYRVLSAVNGGDALAVLAEHEKEVDAILSDMVMPDMNGVEMLTTLKAQGACPAMILMSGYPLDDQGAELIVRGAVAWIQKPMSLLQLSRTISKALESAEAREPDRPT